MRSLIIALAVFAAFAQAIKFSSRPDNSIEEDAQSYLEKLAQTMPRIVS